MIDSILFRRQLCAVMSLFFTYFALETAICQSGVTTRVSVASSNEQGNQASGFPVLSASGRFVVFTSAASNLGSGDSGSTIDAFVRDKATGTTELVSIDPSGSHASNVFSGNCAVNDDGRYVVFSTADGNHMYIRDRLLGKSYELNLTSTGGNGGYCYHPTMSAAGYLVAFINDSSLVPEDTGFQDVYLRTWLAGTVSRLSVSSTGGQPNGDSDYPSISADGHYVAFQSSASNLVEGDTNGKIDIFVRDVNGGTTERVSIGTGGAQPNGDCVMPSISADGRFVAFASIASNLVPSDSNGTWDVFVRDRLLGTTERVSISSQGWQAYGKSGTYGLQISADGRFVAYDSLASELVPDDLNGVRDVFVRDRIAGTTERVSVSRYGEEGNLQSGEGGVSISGDGKFVGFGSDATNLVDNDTNQVGDVFLHELSATFPVVSGRIDFELLSNGVLPPSKVTFQVAIDGVPWSSTDADVAPDGSYSFETVTGSLSLALKQTHWLRQRLNVDTSQGDVGGIDFDLINGDAYVDNKVDLRDLTALFLDFGTTEPRSDLSGNGQVDLKDITIVFLNFGLIGDP